jgi:hypothetical protein
MRDRPIAQEEVDALVAPAVGDTAVAALPRVA